MGEWRESTVGEIAAPARNALVGGPFGSNLVSRDYVEAGVPIIRGQNMGGRWVAGEFAYVSDAKANSLDANLARPGDIVFTQRGTLGQVSVVPSAKFDRYLVSQSQMKLTVNRELADPLFIYYVFSTAEQQDYIRQNAIQTGVPHTNLGILRGTPVPLPPLREQRAIAHILGALDDKIELNRRMNETLEAMARALFKSWFVDFDPVRAKAEGRDPGLPQPLADLFPDSFEDSELGEIPKGWRVAPLSDCVDVARGLSYKGSGLSRDGLPMHYLNSIYEGGGYKHDGLKYYEGEYKPHHVARAGDLIVANTEQGHHRLLIGYAAVVPACFDGESLFSHHIYRVRPKNSSGLTPDYLCELLNTRVMHDTVSGYANGTTVNMLPIDGLQSPLILVPPLQVVVTFNDIAEAAHKRHEEMVEESRTLAALRDTLLPQLISGALRIDATERFIKESII
jgi:type I restriction enzyme S subunit